MINKQYVDNKYYDARIIIEGINGDIYDDRYIFDVVNKEKCKGSFNKNDADSIFDFIESNIDIIKAETEKHILKHDGQETSYFGWIHINLVETRLEADGCYYDEALQSWTLFN